MYRLHTRELPLGSQGDSGAQKPSQVTAGLRIVVSRLATPTLLYFSTVRGPRPQPKVKEPPPPFLHLPQVFSAPVGKPPARPLVFHPHQSSKISPIGLKTKDPRPRAFVSGLQTPFDSGQQGGARMLQRRTLHTTEPYLKLRRLRFRRI